MRVRKITSKALGIVEAGQEVYIGGIAKGYEIKKSDFGDSLRFTGEFVASDVNGEPLEALSLYLPRIAEEWLENAVDNATDEGTGVIFGIRVVTIEDKTTKTGYRYGFDVIKSSVKDNSDYLWNAIFSNEVPEELENPMTGKLRNALEA